MKLVKPRARPPVEIPDKFANASVQLLGTVEQAKHYALAHIDQLGVIERLRFVDVARQAARWAHLLRVRHFQPGDRVLVLADRDRDWRAALLGVLEAGGIAVPCPGSTPEAEIGATAADASSAIVLSPRPRPDLGNLRASVFSADDLDERDGATAMLEMPHTVLPDDPALILYARDASGLNGAVHSHASLIAQGSAGDRWLGVSEDERVWCTAPEGSVASIWLLFGAWHARAEILVVEEVLEPAAELELVNKLRPAAVWLSADEYEALTATDVPPWIDAGSIRRALVTGEAGATTVRQIFGVSVEPVVMSNATGVVWAEPVTSPPNAPSAPEPAGDADARRRDAERKAHERRREEARRSRNHAEQEAKERQRQEARDRTERERQQAAEAHRRAEEDEQRERAEKEARRKAEQAAQEREKQEARQRAEQQRRQAEQERERERERQHTEKEARRQAKQQAKERAQEEERLRREQQKMHAAAERTAAEESVRVEEARLAELEEARAEDDRQRLESERRAAEADRRREEQQRRTAAERAANERLAPDIIASISQYGVAAPVANRDGSGEKPLPAEPHARREAE